METHLFEHRRFELARLRMDPTVDFVKETFRHKSRSIEVKLKAIEPYLWQGLACARRQKRLVVFNDLLGPHSSGVS